MNQTEMLEFAIKTAKGAGAILMEHFGQISSYEHKSTPIDLLTIADTQSESFILNAIKTTFPDHHIIAEESTIVENNSDYRWVIDPLDGTKEFIKQNGEFTVNIALIHKNEPILGVVYAPVLDKLYFGGKDLGAYMGENMDPQHKLELIENETDTVRIVASRSHLNDETANYIEKFDNAQTVSMGSSLKFMLIADSEADIYPRFAPTMEWDTAAAHAVLKGLDLEVINMEDDQPLRYNKENLLNPHFLVKR